MEHSQACIKEGVVSPEAVEKLIAGDFSDNSEKLQCFTLCFFRKAGILDADGIAVEKDIIDKLSIGGDRSKVVSAVNKCKGVRGTSPCETAFKGYKCYFDENGTAF